MYLLSFHSDVVNIASPDDPISVSTDSTVEVLNKCVKQLIANNESGDSKLSRSELERLQFEFIIEDFLFCEASMTIEQFLKQYKLDYGEQLEVLFKIKDEPPKFNSEFDLDESDDEETDKEQNELPPLEIVCLRSHADCFLSLDSHHNLRVFQFASSNHSKSSGFAQIGQSAFCDQLMTCAEWMPSGDAFAIGGCYATLQIIGLSCNTDQMKNGDVEDESSLFDWRIDCQGHQGRVTALAVMPSSSSSLSQQPTTRLASADSDGVIKLWDISQSENGSKNGDSQSESIRHAVMTMQLSNAAISGIGWLSNNVESATSSQLVSCGYDCAIKLWDLNAANENDGANFVRPIAERSFNAQIMCMASSSSVTNHNQSVLIGDSQCRMMLVDLREPKNTTANQSGATLLFKSHHGGPITDLRWHPIDDEHKFVSACRDGLLRLWDVRNPMRPLFDLGGRSCEKSGQSEQTMPILTADWANNGAKIISGQSGAVQLYDYA